MKKNPWSKGPKDSCPKCNKEDKYDGDKIRLVKGIQYGYRVGMGYSKSDKGVDILNRTYPRQTGVFRADGIYCSVM